METCINYCSTECAYVSSDERHWINTIHRLNEQNPDKVQILAEPKDNDGCIYAKVPVKWVRITPPKKVEMTEERKNELRQRLKNARERKQYSM